MFRSWMVYRYSIGFSGALCKSVGYWQANLIWLWVGDGGYLGLFGFRWKCFELLFLKNVYHGFSQISTDSLLSLGNIELVTISCLLEMAHITPCYQPGLQQ